MILMMFELIILKFYHEINIICKYHVFTRRVMYQYNPFHEKYVICVIDDKWSIQIKENTLWTQKHMFRIWSQIMRFIAC